MEEMSTTFRRLYSAGLTVLSSFLMAIIMLLADIGFDWLIGVAVGEGTKTHIIVGFVLDVVFASCAVVWVVGGALVATWEMWSSLKRFVKKN